MYKTNRFHVEVGVFSNRSQRYGDMESINFVKQIQAWIQGRWNGWIFTPLFLSPLLFFFFLIPQILMHRPQTPQPGFGSITLLQKFTPHFKILDPRLRSWSWKVVVNLLRKHKPEIRMAFNPSLGCVLIWSATFVQFTRGDQLLLLQSLRKKSKQNRMVTNTERKLLKGDTIGQDIRCKECWVSATTKDSGCQTLPQMLFFTYLEQFITSSSRVQLEILVTNLSTPITFRIWSPGWGIKAQSGLQNSAVWLSGMSRFSCRTSNFQPFHCQSVWLSFVRWL